MNVCLSYFLGGVVPERQKPHAKVMDDALRVAFGTYDGFEQDDAFMMHVLISGSVSH